MSSPATGNWVLGVDFGTCFTMAAVRNGDRADILEIDGQRRLPSGVMALEDGSLVLGDEAERRSLMAPDRVERAPKRYLDVGQPGIPLGDRLVPTEDVVGRIFHHVWDEALRQHSGVRPAEVRLTHPATWGEGRRQLLLTAATAAGMHDVMLLSEPEAAALYLTEPRVAGEPIEEDGVVVVYDLGGGTFDLTLLRRHGSGFEPAGEPRGDDHVGGDLFDERLYRWLGEHALAPGTWEQLLESSSREWRYANHEFRRAVTAAKETISRTATCPVYVPAPVDRELQVTRSEFEDLIRVDVDVTLDLLEETMDAANARAERLAALFLIGGSSRIPLVIGSLRRRFGRADFKGDPKAVVALGAAQAPRRRVAPFPGRQPPPVNAPPGPAAEPKPRPHDGTPADFLEPVDAGVEPADNAELRASPVRSTPIRPEPGRAASMREELIRDPRRELVLDLVEELVTYARLGVQRILVLRDVALVEANGIGSDAVLDYAKRVADDHLVLTAIGTLGKTPPPWEAMKMLVAPLTGRDRTLDAALPWVREIGGLRKVAHPIDARRERRSAKGKADRLDRKRHADAIFAVVEAAAREQPVLCVLDEVPHFDQPSFDALRTLSLSLVGFSKDQPPARIVMIVVGGRHTDPDPSKDRRGTSLYPSFRSGRRDRDRLLRTGPFVVHQLPGAAQPASLRAMANPPIRESGLRVV